MKKAETLLNNGLDLLKSVKVVNWHEHVWEYPEGSYNENDTRGLIDGSEKFFVDTLVCSTPETGLSYCPIEVARRKNDVLASAMKKFPIIKGMCFIDPQEGRDAVVEIERCVRELGMVGVKMYHQRFMDDESQFPIVEKCIELDIPILMHAGKLTFEPESQPRISGGEHFAHIAERYPEANLIMAHITGGGDWDWQIKAIADYDNISLDISGSVIDSHVIEKCVEAIGSERILFGTDGSICSGIGKILGAEISEDDKKIILEGRRYAKFLDRR